MVTRYDDLPVYEPERPRKPLSNVRKKRLRRTIIWIASALVFVLLLGGGYVTYNYRHLVNGITKIGGVIGDDGGTSGSAQNILLIGNDQRPANMTAAQYAELSTTPDGGSANTDTMILLHIAANGSSATLVSFPRDSLVDIPGYGKQKLNAAYVYGKTYATGTTAQKEAAGVKLLVTTIQNLSGLTINHYVKVSLLSFYNIAKALGPVQVCLKNATKDAYSGADFTAGTQSLDAKQALSFVRQRHGLPNGDLDRAVRQQYFLSVEAQQILSAGTLLNPAKLNKVTTAIGTALETDDKLNLISLAKQVKGLKSGNIKSATLPLEKGNEFSDVAGVGSVDNIDYDALPDFFATVADLPTAAQRVQKASAAKPASVTVDVLNGAGTASGSSDALATFKAAGFQTGEPQNASAIQSTTTIYFPSGKEAQAKAVSQHLYGAALTQSSSYQNVTVVLGTDGITPTQSVQTAPTKSSSSPSQASSTTSASATPSSTTSSYSKTTCIN